MNKIYFTLIKVIIVISVLLVFAISVYEKVQQKTALIQQNISEANELIKSSKENRKVHYVGNEKIGYLIYSDKTNVYMKNLKDTNHITQLLRILDSTRIVQKFSKIR